jgi:hypothetical protein
MKIFFVKWIFSKQVSKWWINLQQQHIASGDEPCRTWNGMQVVLQCRFDHPLEHPIPEINKDVMALRNILFALSRLSIHRGVFHYWRCWLDSV